MNESAFSESSLAAARELFKEKPFDIAYSCAPRFGLWKRSIFLFGRWRWWFPTWKSPMTVTCNDPKLLEWIEDIAADAGFVDENAQPI